MENVLFIAIQFLSVKFRFIAPIISLPIFNFKQCLVKSPVCISINTKGKRPRSVHRIYSCRGLCCAAASSIFIAIYLDRLKVRRFSP